MRLNRRRRRLLAVAAALVLVAVAAVSAHLASVPEAGVQAKLAANEMQYGWQAADGPTGESAESLIAATP